MCENKSKYESSNKISLLTYSLEHLCPLIDSPKNLAVYFPFSVNTAILVDLRIRSFEHSIKSIMCFIACCSVTPIIRVSLYIGFLNCYQPFLVRIIIFIHQLAILLLSILAKQLPGRHCLCYQNVPHYMGHLQLQLLYQTNHSWKQTHCH